MRKLLLVVALLMYACTAGAVQFSGPQTGPNVWTYTLTYDPLDNYSICKANTTITISGLSGVVSAGAPTSTDYSNPTANTENLKWTPQVLNAGTTVVWTSSGFGTGNSGVSQHVYGFTITGTGTPGTASFNTSGFARDGTCPTQVLDISGLVAGPTATGGVTVSVPTLSEIALALLGVALLCLGLNRSLRGRFNARR